MVKNTARKAAKKVPATLRSSDQQGHPIAENFNLWAKMADLQRQMGVHHSPDGKSPGDIAWEGSCEGTTKVVCYYDEDMQPTNCRNVPC